MENKWQEVGNRFDVGSVASMKDQLPVGIYSLEMDSRTGALFLEKLQDNFEFNYKMYGIQNNFIKRVLTTYYNTKGNLGILLNGIKGTGKSVTAKTICNEMGLPVILINKGFGGVPDFINQIQQDVVIFVDEFEKVFNKEEENGSLLTVMDGVLDNGSRRLFLLTTNHLRVNENLLQRPGRIRYLKTFVDLDKETIEMIVDDCLIYPEHREETIKFISKLELITVDIVKAVISEVNIHNESPEAFKDVFNVEEKDDKYNIYWLTENMERRIKVVNDIEDLYDDNNKNYYEFYIPGKGRYYFDSWIDENNMIAKIKIDNYSVKDEKLMYETIKIEKVRSYHSAFAF